MTTSGTGTIENVPILNKAIEHSSTNNKAILKEEESHKIIDVSSVNEDMTNKIGMDAPQPTPPAGLAWLEDQKKEDIFEEIICNSKKTNLTHLRRVGWNGIPDRFRAPSWHLLLNYLPATKSKRKSSLRRKRIEYHRYITQHYFEFDFGLTDRSPSTSSLDADAARTPAMEAAPKHKNGRRRGTSSKHQAEPSKSETKSSDEITTKEENTSLKQQARQDNLLRQVRSEVDQMVFTPTRSSGSQNPPPKKVSKTVKCLRNKISRLSSKKTVMKSSPSSSSSSNSSSQRSITTDAIVISKMAMATTSLRLFANPRIKSCIERILYLTAVREEMGYVSGMTDMVMPLFWVSLQGYVWGTHVSVTSDEVLGEEKKEDMEDDVDRTRRNTKPDIAGTIPKEKPLPSLNVLPTNRPNPMEKHRALMNETSTEKKVMVDSQVMEEAERQEKTKICRDLANGKSVNEIIPDDVLDEIEADTYWCLHHLLSGIQEHRYNTASSTKKTSNSGSLEQNMGGIQKMIILMERVIHRVDPALHKHLQMHGVEFLWFAFRWMNCLLVREMNDICVLRLWDTFFCEEGVNRRSWAHRKHLRSYVTSNALSKSNSGGSSKRKSTGGIIRRSSLNHSSSSSSSSSTLSGFHSFQVYVCAALLHRVRHLILSKHKFEDILNQLRCLPTKNWNVQDISLMLSQAFVWRETFYESERQLLLSVSYGEEFLVNWIKKCHWPPRKSTSRPMDSVQTLTNVMYDVEGVVLLSP